MLYITNGVLYTENARATDYYDADLLVYEQICRRRS